MFVCWGPRPFVGPRMTFSYSCWLQLWLDSYLDSFWTFSTHLIFVRKTAAYEINENKMHTKYSGVAVIDKYESKNTEKGGWEKERKRERKRERENKEDIRNTRINHAIRNSNRKLDQRSTLCSCFTHCYLKTQSETCIRIPALFDRACKDRLRVG